MCVCVVRVCCDCHICERSNVCCNIVSVMGCNVCFIVCVSDVYNVYIVQDVPDTSGV